MVSFGNRCFLVGADERALQDLESRLASRYIPLCKTGAYVSALSAAISAVFITTMPWLAITGMALGALFSTGFHEAYIVADNYLILIRDDLEKLNSEINKAKDGSRLNLLSRDCIREGFLELSSNEDVNDLTDPNPKKLNFCLDRYLVYREQQGVAEVLTDKLLKNTWILSRFCSDWIKSHISLR